MEDNLVPQEVKEAGENYTPAELKRLLKVLKNKVTFGKSKVGITRKVKKLSKKKEKFAKNSRKISRGKS